MYLEDKQNALWGAILFAIHFTVNFTILLFFKEATKMIFIPLCLGCYALMWVFILEYKITITWDDTWRRILEKT